MKTLEEKIVEIQDYFNKTVETYGFLPGKPEILRDLLTRWLVEPTSLGYDPRWFVGYDQAFEWIKLVKDREIETVSLQTHKVWSVMLEIAEERNDVARHYDIYHALDWIMGYKTHTYASRSDYPIRQKSENWHPTS